MCGRIYSRQHTSRDHPLGNAHLFKLLGGIAPLIEIDVFNVGAGEVVFPIAERLDLFQHDVVDIEPGVSV